MAKKSVEGVIVKLPKSRAPKKIEPSAMHNNQMSLFQSFLCNTTEERNQLSNTIALWDSIPRFSVSRQAMTKMRSAEGRLRMLKLDFQYQGDPWRVVITPARFEAEDPDRPGETMEIDFYPSANEELVEDALRKIAAEQRQGFFDKGNFRSGAVFSLHTLREELSRRGHTRSFQEIIISLNILAKSTIEIFSPEGKGGAAVSAYLPALAAVTREDWSADPSARWAVQFHPLVTQSIDQVTYRQFNYHVMMTHKAQLARWIHRQLALKFTFAAHGRTFDMYYSTIERDSCLLYGIQTTRRRFEAVEEALAELQENKVLMYYEVEHRRGARNKLEDAKYVLAPSLEFIAEMKAANKRLQIASKEVIEQQA